MPTLILHRTADPFIEVEHARYLARHIVEAELIEFSGEVHLPWLGDRDAILDKVEQYLTGGRRVREPERMLATVLFVDIVGSTERAAALGDLRWRELPQTFYVRVRELLRAYRGREIRIVLEGLRGEVSVAESAARKASIRTCITGGQRSSWRRAKSGWRAIRHVRRLRMKNRILLENYYLPGELELNIGEAVTYYNNRRYHESLDNLTPADLYFGRGPTILKRRETIKRKTIQQRRRLHQQAIAA